MQKNVMNSCTVRLLKRIHFLFIDLGRDIDIFKKRTGDRYCAKIHYFVLHDFIFLHNCPPGLH